ncbi:MAG: hypothetical protein AB8H86_19430 [Polyangiales bacterium]
MPLSPAQSWRSSYSFTPDLDRLAEPPPKPDFPIHQALALFRVTMAFSRAPLLGALVGGVGTAALLHRHHVSAPSPRRITPRPSGVLTFGAEGLRLLGTFHPWRSIKRAGVHKHVTLHFFDGREWHFHTPAARKMAAAANHRMRWGPSRRHVLEEYQYTEALGLPFALDVTLSIAKRVSDYRRLDDPTKLRVLYSMADLNTRATFVKASGPELQKRWMKRPMSHE